MSDSSSSSNSESSSPKATNSNAITTIPPTAPAAEPSSSKIQTAIASLNSIIPSLSISSPISLLHDRTVSSQISSLLRSPDSGAGDNNLCRWLYDTFQSTDPSLQLAVLRFLPAVAGVYLSRVPQRKPQAGFEAVLLAIYAHETTSRAGQAITVNVPDLTHPSVYHESKTPVKNDSTKLNIAVISPTLEPHGTVRSTRRARIVGVALEFYYSRISEMPADSKIDFCDFCLIWSGENGDMYKEDADDEDEEDEDENGDVSEEEEAEEKKVKMDKEGRIPLPWELLQPVLRILGHCLLGPNVEKEVFDRASAACRSLYARALHDVNCKAIMATGSLLRSRKILLDSKNDVDYTEISDAAVITI